VSAVDDLLAHLSAVDEMVDFAGISPSSASPNILEGILCGAAIRTFSAVEEFFRQRAKEWAAYITTSRWSPLIFPNGMILFQNRLVSTFPVSFGRADLASRTQLSGEIGKTFISMNSSYVEGHHLLFGWTGSNVKAKDVEDILVMVGIKKSWNSLTNLWQRVDAGFPMGGNARAILNLVAEARHTAAHEVSPILNATQMRSVTRQARMIALLFDAAVSTALGAISAGKDPDTVLQSLKIRRIEFIAGKWAEFGVPQKKALRKFDSQQDAMVSARRRPTAASDLIIAFDGLNVVNWTSPI